MAQELAELRRYRQIAPVGSLEGWLRKLNKTAARHPSGWLCFYLAIQIFAYPVPSLWPVLGSQKADHMYSVT